jgi:hypothetical protein
LAAKQQDLAAINSEKTVILGRKNETGLSGFTYPGVDPKEIVARRSAMRSIINRQAELNFNSSNLQVTNEYYEKPEAVATIFTHNVLVLARG